MRAKVRLRRATADDCAQVSRIVYAVLEEYGLRADPDGADADLSALPQYYSDPGGLFCVLLDDAGAISGTIGLLPLDERRIELRKMYFSRAFRGRGAGKALLDWAIGQARARGFESMELETAAVLKEALGLYRAFGFTDSDDGPDTCRCDYRLTLRLNDYRAPGGLAEVCEVSE